MRLFTKKIGGDEINYSPLISSGYLSVFSRVLPLGHKPVSSVLMMHLTVDMHPSVFFPHVLFTL